MSKQIALPADVYDTLHFSSLVFGGIGRGAWFEEEPGLQDYTPRCPLGHLVASGVITDTMTPGHAFGLTWTVNDGRLVNVPTDDHGRITFRRWCRALNVVRGES